MLRIALLAALAVVVVLSCEHPAWSPDNTVLMAGCGNLTTCGSDADCDHGQQCCFEVDGCSSVCYHPTHTPHPHSTHASHTTHPHGAGRK